MLIIEGKIYIPTFDISLACHLRCAVESSSVPKPESTFALSRPTIGDLLNPEGSDSVTKLAETKDAKRSLISCRRDFSKKTTKRDRLSLKYISNLSCNQ